MVLIIKKGWWKVAEEEEAEDDVYFNVKFITHHEQTRVEMANFTQNNKS